MDDIVGAEPTFCKLCLRERPLSRSHIVPQFAYRPLKNGKGQIFVLGRKKRVVQTGHFERLLCSDCEGVISRYESEFAKDWMQPILADANRLMAAIISGVLFVEISDWVKFKLFHLSVFWRAAASSSFEIDSKMQFGKHERTIADMLLKGDPGQPGEFFCLGSLNFDKDGRPVPTVSPLARFSEKFEGTFDRYLMSYAFCDWILFDGPTGPPFLVDAEAFLRTNGNFILMAGPFQESNTASLFTTAMRSGWRT
jgi:hypothetical protein